MPARRALRQASLALPLLIGIARDREAGARSQSDEDEVVRVQSTSPRAVDLLEEGEALARQGRVSEAEGSFHDGLAFAPDFSILERRDCEALRVVGHDVEAQNSCMLAVQNRPAPDSLLAMVRSLVDGAAAPSPLVVAQALAFASAQRERTARGTPTPAAMRCDVAARLGDGSMLEQCARELETNAPQELEGVRARHLLAQRCPPLRFWSGWALIGGTGLATALHAARRRSMRRSVARAAAGAAVLVATALDARTASAGPGIPEGTTPPGLTPAEPGYLSKWAVDDDAPDSKIPTEDQRNADPLEFGYWIQDVALKGEHASKRGDHLTAVKYYSALVKAVPDRAVGYVKVCEEYEAAGDLDRARAACGAALLHDGLTVKDYSHYVRLVLAQPTPLTDVQKKTLDAVFVHMKEDPAGKDAAVDLKCQVATRTNDVPELKECTDALAAKSPNDPQTVSYQWALAMKQGHYADAKKLVDHAREIGLKSEGVDTMARATAEGESQQHNRIMAAAVAGILFVAGLAVGLGSWLGRRRSSTALPA